MTILVPSFVEGSSLFLQLTRTLVKAWMSLNFGKISSPTIELAVLECLKKTMHNVVTTLTPFIFLSGSSSFLQVTRTTIKSQMGSKFSQIGLLRELPLSVWKNLHRLINGRNVVINLVPSFLDGSSSFLQATRKTIKLWRILL